MANQKVIQEIKLDPSKVMNAAGNIILEDFKNKFPEEIKIIRKFIPEERIEHELNETLARMRNYKWGFTVQEYGAKALMLAVQTPNLGLLKNGSKAQSYSFKIYKKAMKIQLLKATEKAELIKRASVLDLTIRAEKVPAGFTLFKSVTNATGSLYLYNDADVEEGVIYVYRLYTSAANYIEVVHQVKAVTPVISSFTATPDPLERKVKFVFDVTNATTIQIFKGSSTQPLANNTQDTAVVNGSIYSYTLKVSNAWGKTASRTVSARCLNMLPSKPSFSVARDAAYVRANLSWTVYSNVSSCSFKRVKKVGTTATASTTLRPTYSNRSYYDTGVVKGGVYAYTMTATNGWGSTASNTLNITMTGSAPAIPTITSLSTDANAKVTVQYSRSANATGYKIYRTIDGSETYVGASSTISYYDSSVPINEDVTYKVSAYNGWGESAKSAGKQIFTYRRANNQIQRKALCVATKALVHSQVTCQEMKKVFEHNGIAVKYVENLTRKQFESELKSYFGGLDADDYPIIMSNSHGGVDSIQLFIENNSPVTVTYAEYKKMLDKVPGHKILMIGCCHSGSSVTQQTRALKSVFTPASLDAALLTNIKDVFSGAQTTATTRALKSTTATAESAELTTSNYSVLVSATWDESSWGVNGFSEVPTFWGKGLGWDFFATPEDLKPCRHYADSNANKSVTVAELSAYTAANVKNSHPFCWPENDNKVIATYTSDNVNGFRYVTLQNKGAFVVRMKLQITDPQTGSSFTWSAGSFAVNKSKTVDLSTLTSKVGAKIVLVADVVAGKTKKSGVFYYHPDSTKTASYKVSGTTLNVKLTQV